MYSKIILTVNTRCPADVLNEMRGKMSIETLAEKSNLSPSTVSRACSKKNCIRTSRNSLYAMSLAMESSIDQKNKLFDAFYPEENAYDQLLIGKYTVHEANDILEKNDLKQLGECQ